MTDTKEILDSEMRRVLSEWINEMYLDSKDVHLDGTPKMGKFETEQLYRVGRKFLENKEPPDEKTLLGVPLAQMERVQMLAEEAGEVVQICMKILRHGMSSYHPDDPKKTPNWILLQKELLDMWAVYERMAAYGDLARINFYSTAEIWADKLRYTHHQPEFHHPTLKKGK